MSDAIEKVCDLIRAGRGTDAERELRESIERDPDDAALRRIAVELYTRAHQRELALEHARRAVAIEPNFAANHESLGLALMQLQQFNEARQALRWAVESDASLVDAHNALGVMAILDQAYDDAEAHFVAAIESGPNRTAALCNFATMLKDTGRGDEAAALMGPALDMLPDDVGVQWTGAVMSNYAASLAPEQIADRHRTFGAAVKKTIGWQPWLFDNNREPERPLRIGFLSPDLRRHSVAHFLLPLIEAMDGQRYAVACYSLTTKPDEITERFKAVAAGWRDVSAATDCAIVETIRADKIDVLIDCAGLFAGSRPAVLAMRAAPVQATWLGYPNTTGIDAIDVRLIDAVTDPPGAEALAVERLERNEGCFVCFDPLSDAPLPRRERGDGPITFGSFNALSKINDALLDTWARLLREVPDARLLLKAGPLDSEDVRRWVGDEFDHRGVDPGRLEMVGFFESPEDHLAAYGRIDVALDPFPYNGTTTTCEALWMGVPVVTLLGGSHPGRVGASLLTAIGHHEWIAGSIDGYIAIAAGLARDTARLTELHGSLRRVMGESSLMDFAGYARRFESAIRASWQRWAVGGGG